MNNDSGALLERYRAAYQIAHSTIKIGTFVKNISLWTGGIAVSIAIVVLARGDTIVGAISLIVALAAVLCGFALGLIISALGQIMLAILDTAVNTSPFGSLKEKATVLDEGVWSGSPAQEWWDWWGR